MFVMEELEDDDCSDLYADVVVQASSAISAMHRLKEMRHVEDKIVDNGVLTNLPLENGDISGSESEDDLDSGSDDECKQKKDGGIDAKEKSASGGDCHLQRKSLKKDSLSSKKNKVDEMACDVLKSCSERDEELFFKRDIIDNQSRPNNASESCRPVSLEKLGSVQISNSVEDSHHELSDYSSDGLTMETSEDTRRRKRSSTFNKVPSSVEPESSESDWSQRGGSSCSPSPRRDKYVGKSHRYSRHSSSSLDRELQEGITHEYHPSKDSISRAYKRGTPDGRYCDKQRDATTKHSHHPRKSCDVPYLKSRWVDVRRPYTRNVKHGKQREMASFESNRNDMPYSNHSERSLTHSARFLPDYRLEPPYLKNQFSNIHQSYRYKQSWSEDLNMSQRQIFFEKNINKMDYEASRDDWHHNHRRHLGQANIKGSRNLTQRCTQFRYGVDDMQFRRRAKDDYLSPLHESDNKFVEGKYRRMGPTTGRDRDHLDRIYGRNIANQTSGRGKRRHDSSLNSLGNIWYTESDLNDRRNINGRPFPFYSSEEPYAPRRGQYPGSSVPKFGVPEMRKAQPVESARYGIDIDNSDTIESLSYRYSEDHLVKRRHYQQSSGTYVMNESIEDDYDEDNFFRRRSHQHSEVLHSREESRFQGDTIFHSEEPSYHYERISRNNGADYRHAFGHVEGYIDERETNGERSRMIRKQDSSSQFDGYHKSIQPHSHAQMHPRYQDSIDHLVVVGRKCTMQPSRRTAEAGDDKNYDRRDLIGWNDNQKSRNFEDSDNFHSKNAVFTNEEKADISNGDKSHHDETLDIEEGQIISDEIQDRLKRVPQRPLDDEKIQEIMGKMERRKLRFKEPVTTCRDSSVKASYPLPDFNAESDMTKLKRPSRKRRWCGT